MWDLNEALEFIRKQQPTFHEMNAHIALAGSVLNKGYSDKDLDIIVMGMHNNKEFDYQNIINYLDLIGGFPITSKDYKSDGRILYRSIHEGLKVVDWFIY